MSQRTWEQRAAKRMVAEATLRLALEAVEEARTSGGPRTHSTSSHYKIAQHLATHAAEQLRLSDGGE